MGDRDRDGPDRGTHDHDRGNHSDNGPGRDPRDPPGGDRTGNDGHTDHGPGRDPRDPPR